MQAQAGIQELKALGAPAGVEETGPLGLNQRTTLFCTLGVNLWQVEPLSGDRD